MKEYTFNQIYSALSKAVKVNSNIEGLLLDIAEAPYYTTIVRVCCNLKLNNTTHNIPINIVVKDTDIYKAILKEITYKIRKFGYPCYYEDSPELTIEIFLLTITEIYSYSSNNYAIFHKEQECGNSWLCINTDNLTAPITYEDKGVVRSETNDVYYIEH